MRQVLVFVVIFAGVTLAIGGMTYAQEDPATPDLEMILCETPEASPEASPAASPEIDTDASPAAVAEEVIEEIESGLEDVICATPDLERSS